MTEFPNTLEVLREIVKARKEFEKKMGRKVTDEEWFKEASSQVKQVDVKYKPFNTPFGPNKKGDWSWDKFSIDGLTADELRLLGWSIPREGKKKRKG